MAAAEEIWMPQKVHNHDRKYACYNDGQRKEWRGGLRYICDNKRCQTVVRTSSHVFLYLPISNTQRGYWNADLFAVADFRAKTKITNILGRELLFADNGTLIAHSAEEIQRIADAFGLKINIKQTEVMLQRNSTTLI